MTDAVPAPGAAAAAQRRHPGAEPSAPKPSAEKPGVKRAAEGNAAKPKLVRPAPYPMRDFLASHR
jgi:hypothetical protein